MSDPTNDAEDMGAVAASISEALAGGDGGDLSQLSSAMLQNPDFLAALQNTIQGMAGESSGYLESLPKEVKRRINALKNLQKEQLKLEVACHLETAAIEQKYLQQSQELFEKRKAIVSGDHEPTEEEAHWSEDEDEDEAGIKEVGEPGESSTDDDKKAEGAEDMKGIPQFWLTCMQNTPVSTIIQDQDYDCLRHLEDITCEYLPEVATGFKIHFHFSENEFFSNKVLTKTYYLNPQPDEDDLAYAGPVFMKSEGTKIEWKSKEKNLTVVLKQKKQRKKDGSQVRTVTQTKPTDSFFNFFTPPAAPAEDEEIDEEALSELRQQLLEDYEIGDLFLSRIVQSAVLCFTNDLDEDDDFEDDPDDDSYNSDEDPDYQPAQGENPPECKTS